MLRPRLAALPLGLLACVLPALAPAQTTHTWQGTFIDSWSVPENWSTGQIPDAADDTVVFNNPYGSGAEYHIAPPSPPVTIGHIGVAMADAANPLVLGATSDATASLTLATTTGQPTISVASGALAIRGVLAGSQGFAKTGAGTLTFRDNPHPQLFTGPVTLGGGTLEIGADSDLGHTDNDLAVTASATLRAHPADTSVPLVLGAGRDISIPAAATSSPFTTRLPPSRLSSPARSPARVRCVSSAPATLCSAAPTRTPVRSSTKHGRRAANFGRLDRSPTPPLASSAPRPSPPEAKPSSSTTVPPALTITRASISAASLAPSISR